MSDTRDRNLAADHGSAKDMEERSERTELLGSIAAGVAHEFNNVLTVVLSSLDQLRRQSLDERGKQQLERAEWGSRQAARLAQQVLTFMRPERAERHVVDLNEVIAGFDKMLAHVAGDRVALTTQLREQPLPANLDPGQLELALLNLVRNAADAVSDGGHISVSTGLCISADPNEPAMVEVTVRDDGAGMPAAIAERATNAFFTTKPPGRGTGLGLWMVQRFMRGSEGKMHIETAAGRGTTVRLLFPWRGG